MRLDQLQDAVGYWHRSVFGEYGALNHVKTIAQKAAEEAAELSLNPQSAEEVADLMICTLAAADRLGLDMELQVQRKLSILRERGRNQLDRDRERGIVQAKDMVVDSRRLDDLESLVKSPKRNVDIVLCWDHEDGVWLAKLERGYLGGEPLDLSPQCRNLREAIDALKNPGQSSDA